MKVLVIVLICCGIFSQTLTLAVEGNESEFKILRGDDEGAQNDEEARVFAIPAPLTDSLIYEPRSAFNALRINPPFPIESRDEIDTNEIEREATREKRENGKILLSMLNIQKKNENKMDEAIKRTSDNSKFHGAQFIDQ